MNLGVSMSALEKVSEAGESLCSSLDLVGSSTSTVLNLKNGDSDGVRINPR